MNSGSQPVTRSSAYRTPHHQVAPATPTKIAVDRLLEEFPAFAVRGSHNGERAVSPECSRTGIHKTGCWAYPVLFYPVLKLNLLGNSTTECRSRLSVPHSAHSFESLPYLKEVAEMYQFRALERMIDSLAHYLRSKMCEHLSRRGDMSRSY